MQLLSVTLWGALPGKALFQPSSCKMKSNKVRGQGGCRQRVTAALGADTRLDSDLSHTIFPSMRKAPHHDLAGTEHLSQLQPRLPYQLGFSIYQIQSPNATPLQNIRKASLLKKSSTSQSRFPIWRLETSNEPSKHARQTVILRQMRYLLVSSHGTNSFGRSRGF